MQATFTFLGTGASGGVPHIGCDCSVCRSSHPCNQRLRPAGLVQIGGRTLLIDIGPDFRQQALKFGLSQLDGLLITHTHYDHIAGLDELRVINFRAKKACPCLLSEESLRELKTRYSYVFKEREVKESHRVEIDCQILPDDSGDIEFLGIPIRYVSYWQGSMKVNGFRFGSFAYISDIRRYDDSIFHSLKGVKKLVVSALGKEPSHVHFSLDEAVAFARKVGAEQTWLTHLSHAVDHEEICHALPPDVQPGCDGLEISFDYAR